MSTVALQPSEGMGAEQDRLLPDVLNPDIVPAVAVRVLAATRAETNVEPEMSLLKLIAGAR